MDIARLCCCDLKIRGSGTAGSCAHFFLFGCHACSLLWRLHISTSIPMYVGTCTQWVDTLILVIWAIKKSVAAL